MQAENKTKITVECSVNAPIEKVWNAWTAPEHITQWNAAIDEWHCPSATNDLTVGGKFSYRMEAKDGSFGFDFWGIYDSIKEKEQIESTLGDDRKVQVVFESNGSETKVIETFEAESQNPVEMQRGGWQAILNNFKKHVENC